MVNNVNTNPGALIALQNLTQISQRLEETQRRVSTGLEVSSARDNPALFALAQNQRAELGSIESVQQGIRIGTSTVDVALAAGESISDILVEMRAIASQAADPAVSTEDLAVLEDQYVALRDQISRLVDTAEIGGRNLLESGATDLSVVAGTDGTQTITVAAQDLSVGGANVTVSSDDTVFAAFVDTDLTDGDDSLSITQVAQAEIAAIEASIGNVSRALGSLGAGANSLDLQNDILTRVSDALEVSIGNLVDADLARESSRLQALQVQQQLAIQTLSIANAAPNAILALFA
ncbi:MAG: flagellin [Pseudomonadota bacterium]